MTSSTTPDNRFGFGQNWSQYVEKSLNPERIRISQEHLLAFLGRENLEGEQFLDIGCGSGVHSLAAKLSGAAKIHSFDFDENSVAATKSCRELEGNPDYWQVERGDVLDAEYMASLGQWPLVYSWGVLHHTGDVWRALENAVTTVAPNGYFYVALYSADREKKQEWWSDYKKKFANSSKLKQEYLLWSWILRKRIKFRPWRIPRFMKEAREYKKHRGMDLVTDIRDWLGGWPMEWAKDQDVIDFLEARGFEIRNIDRTYANTEFLAQRTGAGTSS